MRQQNQRLFRRGLALRIKAGVNVDDRDHFVAVDDHALNECWRGRDAGRLARHDDLPYRHDVDEERLWADAEADEAKAARAHARTRNFRTSSSRLRMASDSSVSESFISL